MPALASLPARIFSIVEYRHLRFLIHDCPTEANLQFYLAQYQKNNVIDVVRVCDATYATNLLVDNGIQVHDLPFADGGVPHSNAVITPFLMLCESRFGSLTRACDTAPTCTIAVHCVAGLGRAPIMVALALIEAGMKPLDAVDHVRRSRRGAFNSVQLKFLLDTYRPGRILRSGPNSNGTKDDNLKGSFKVSLFKIGSGRVVGDGDSGRKVGGMSKIFASFGR